MEYVEGQTLKELITGVGAGLASARATARVAPTINEIINITLQICEGLSAAHKVGIVHRDIKPQNILVNKEGRVKILDFGLAKLRVGANGYAPSITKIGTTMGTTYYMSPEQIQGLEVDHRTDIWSLGVVLFEMITGQLPFQGEYEQAIMYAILNEELEPLENRRPEFPEELKLILSRALDKNEKKRYQQVEELEIDLKKLRKKLESEDTNKTQISKESENSIAVLPFVNMSAETENEYFSDGLSEELINSLTQLKNLRVVARTSAFAFKGKELDIRDIGNKLNVNTILEGSVRKAGNKLRIIAQLINVADGYHIWSERYDRDLKDVFAIQDEIAREIANKLKTRFRDKSGAHSIGTLPDMSAYEFYLKGRYHFNKFSPEWINQAIDSFSKAIAIDKEFAPAYAGLADAYIFISTPLGALKSNVAMPKAKEAAEKALRLNPNLSEAYVSLGAIATFYDWNSKKAHQYFKQAIELNPNNTNARIWYEMTLSLLDQNFDEALAHLTIALNLDPLNLLVRLRIGYVYCYKYDFETAIRYFQQIIHAEPANAAGYHGLMDSYGMMGKYDSAIREGEKAVKLGNSAAPFVSILGAYSARGGKTKRAEELLAILLKRMETEYVSPFWIAVIYMGLNEYDKMFEWFEKAFIQRDGNLLYLFAPPLDLVREDQRFIKLRQKMGFKK
jgi:serine/threonine-protein kinase